MVKISEIKRALGCSSNVKEQVYDSLRDLRQRSEARRALGLSSSDVKEPTLDLIREKKQPTNDFIKEKYVLTTNVVKNERYEIPDNISALLPHLNPDSLSECRQRIQVNLDLREIQRKSLINDRTTVENQHKTNQGDYDKKTKEIEDKTGEIKEIEGILRRDHGDLSQEEAKIKTLFVKIESTLSGAVGQNLDSSEQSNSQETQHDRSNKELMARFKALQKSFNETSTSRVKRTKSILESKNKININIDKLDEKFSKNKSDLHLAHVNWTSWVNTERNPSARELHQSLEIYLEHYSIYYPHLVDIGRKLQKNSQHKKEQKEIAGFGERLLNTKKNLEDQLWQHEYDIAQYNKLIRQVDLQLEQLESKNVKKDLEKDLADAEALFTTLRSARAILQSGLETQPFPGNPSFSDQLPPRPHGKSPVAPDSSISNDHAERENSRRKVSWADQKQTIEIEIAPSSSVSSKSKQKEIQPGIYLVDSEKQTREGDPSSSNSSKSKQNEQWHEVPSASIYGNPAYISGILNGAPPLDRETETKQADPSPSSSLRDVLTKAATSYAFSTALNKALGL